jgi:integration host factor subunit beta
LRSSGRPRYEGHAGGVVTKSELIEEVARQAPDISKRDVEIIVDTIFRTMTTALARHDRIEIRGFGSFIAKPRRAREGRNPRTGEKVSVPQKWVPFFTCGKELKERVNTTVASTKPAAVPAR